MQPVQKAFFLTYLREIQRWNRVVNLTGLRDEAGIIRSLFAAAALWPLPQEEPGGRFLDVGSGAGIPGIPLKILHPEGTWTLLERSRRKASFLKHMAALLGLPGLHVVGADLQELARDESWRGQFQVVVSRAALKLPRLVSSCLPLMSPGGVLITQKGEGFEQEIAQASGRCERFGGDLEGVQEILSPWGARLRFVTIRRRGL
ncbi:MAG: 16S rRNA (guanine(527)-N(7))-methyltransferase RsmG [Candidatus Tectomicrobia bacterium]|uniref:Ribosomal RNA small subunit methyltransferase G n=1 Tax=Tectimicrobiota bacterium TaxID=2528274 RepID=A0A932M198_UNCTE|nr:16S rRNA (guanine(527)-N(7))-methyltransferase RsmG [Candidatus Tectomicrobia bacterium]